MDISDVVFRLAEIGLIYQQNRILDRTNVIMTNDQKKPKSKAEMQLAMPMSRWDAIRERLKPLETKWPVIIIVLLVAGQWTYPLWSKWVFGTGTLVVAISAAESPMDIPQLSVIDHETFEDNSSVPLDGHIYKDCTFINSCLMYDGGAYRLENATFEGTVKVCARMPRLMNFEQLESDLHPEHKPVEKKKMLPVFANPAPSD